MLYRRLLAGLMVVVALCVGAPVTAQKDKDKDKGKKEPKTPAKAVILKWKFDKSDKGKFYQTMTTDTTQTMTVMGNPVVQKQKQTFYFSWKPISSEGDSWRIEQKIEGVKMEIDIGGSKITYDSVGSNPANNPLADFFKALEKAVFTITLDTSKLEVTKIEGREAFVDSLVKANPQMKPLLEQILSEPALKEMAAPTFAVIPDSKEFPSGVVPGKSWPRTTNLDMGPIGKYTNTYTYTLEGKEDAKSERYKINVLTTLKYTPPGENVNPGGLPFKIKSADLTSKNATGTIIFNNDTGRVEESKMSLDLSGKLSIEIGGQTTVVELKQSQTSTVVTSDVPPPELKKKG